MTVGTGPTSLRRRRVARLRKRYGCRAGCDRRHAVRHLPPARAGARGEAHARRRRRDAPAGSGRARVLALEGAARSTRRRSRSRTRSRPRQQRCAGRRGAADRRAVRDQLRPPPPVVRRAEHVPTDARSLARALSLPNRSSRGSARSSTPRRRRTSTSSPRVFDCRDAKSKDATPFNDAPAPDMRDGDRVASSPRTSSRRSTSSKRVSDASCRGSARGIGA